MTEPTEDEFVELPADACVMYPFTVPVEFNPNTREYRFKTDERTEATSECGYHKRVEHFFADGDRFERDEKEEFKDALASLAHEKLDMHDAIYAEMLDLVDDERFVIAQMHLDDCAHDPLEENAPDEYWQPENAREVAQSRLKNLITNYDDHDVEEFTRDAFPEYAKQLDDIRTRVQTDSDTADDANTQTEYSIRADRQPRGTYEGDSPKDAFISYTRETGNVHASVTVEAVENDEDIETFHARGMEFKWDWFDGRPPQHPQNTFSLSLVKNDDGTFTYEE